MPTYQYSCSSCKNEWEAFHKIDDRAIPVLAPCPYCSKSTVYIVIGAPPLCDPVRIGVTKPPKEFTEHLERIKKLHPLGKLQT